VPDDLRAWNLVADALDEALALLLRMRAFTSFLGERPQLVEARAPAPADNLYDLPGQPGGAA
jgi:hypothetical protein